MTSHRPSAPRLTRVTRHAPRTTQTAHHQHLNTTLIPNVNLPVFRFPALNRVSPTHLNLTRTTYNPKITMAEATSTPRITAQYLDSYVGRNVMIVGKIVQLRGDEAIMDSAGNITLALDRVRATPSSVAVLR